MKDYLTLHLRELPYFRALLRAVEARFYKDISLPGPVLDLGCGAGRRFTVAHGDLHLQQLDPCVVRAGLTRIAVKEVGPARHVLQLMPAGARLLA